MDPLFNMYCSLWVLLLAVGLACRTFVGDAIVEFVARGSLLESWVEHLKAVG
jgi:hypothetical protein